MRGARPGRGFADAARFAQNRLSQLKGTREMSEQSARSVVMIRPCRFYPNPETAADNAFQRELPPGATGDLSDAARKEFDRAVALLSAGGVTVHVFEDTPEPETPDAVFPNNWFSTHDDGRIVLYPMFTPSRRRERRDDIIASLREKYRVSEVVDYTGFEKEGLYLEGTGSLVFDHLHRVVYVSLSRRAQLVPLEKFCADFGYEAVTFESTSADGRPIYHTNVMMCVGTEVALVGLESIPDSQQRATVRRRLEASGRRIIELSPDQIENFAGNALELQGREEKLLVLSERALGHLTKAQRAILSGLVRLLPLSLPTIELAGGSARCMLATIHLPLR
jgi:hypothetical protein